MSASPLDRYRHFDEFADPLETNEGTLTPAVRKARARANIGVDGVFSDPVTQAITATAALSASSNIYELAHASVVIAATLVAPTNKTIVIKNTSASGTAAHTVTLTGGTFDGTNNTLTTNAPGEYAVVAFNASGVGNVLFQSGVALSSV